MNGGGKCLWPLKGMVVVIINADALQHTTNAIASCVVLHNICEQLGDACQPEWIHTDSEAPVVPAGTPAAMTTSVGSSNKKYYTV